MFRPLEHAPAAVCGCVALICAAVAAADQYVYPARHQSVGQQAHDESECSSEAAHQSGFRRAAAIAAGPELVQRAPNNAGADPGGAKPSPHNAGGRAVYDRAWVACLTKRGYSVRSAPLGH